MSANDIQNSSEEKLSTNERKDFSVEDANVTRGFKPIVLSSQRYEKLLNNATDEEARKTKYVEDEKKNLEELEAGNEELVAQFKGSNMQRTEEQKKQQMIDALDRKTKFAIQAYEQAKENEAQKRREKIAQAQKLVERLKPGPRELQSAVMQSEVLRARKVQIEIDKEFKEAIKKQDCETQKRCRGQNMAFIQEEQHRLVEMKKNENNYKRELLQTIHDNQRLRSEQRAQLIREQQAARVVNDLEIKAQIEKEKAIMERKRETLRKNALEAMRMVEQRRMRENLADQLENRLCCVYHTGKRQLNDLVTEQNKQLATDQQKKVDEEVKKLEAIDDNKLAIEGERIRRDISTMQLKFTAEEQEKIRKDKAAKQARIEAYIRETEAEKQAQLRACEEKRFEVALRYKNTEVNAQFVQRQQQERIRNAQNVRSYLDKQIEEKQRYNLGQRMVEPTCTDDVLEKEHQFFFQYARDLMEDAQQKDRPLYPIIRAVQNYKKENLIDCERKVPKHLETHIDIGQSSTGGGDEQQENNPTLDNVLQNCLKIDEIILKSKKPEPPIENDCKMDLCKNVKPPKDNDDCASVSSSAKYRYSVDDLKKLNPFPDPTY